MATKAQEVEVLGDGIQANAPSKGSFALNMLYANNAWQVREGFGQVTQFDTMMAARPQGQTTVWGFTKHLGSHLIKTNFGNLQMLSVFLADVEVAVVATAGPKLPLYIVSIYDLTTNERFEVPLYPHTSQSAVAASFDDAVPSTLGGRDFGEVAAAGVENMSPQYQTSDNADHSAWVMATDEFFFFEEFLDILYFGNSIAGCWAYIPASFNGLRRTDISKLTPHEYAQPYGESNIITPVVLSPGIHATGAFGGIEYLRTADMPNPVDVAVVGRRLVYASGNTIYFSEPGYPSNIMADNWRMVPSEEEITAIAERDSNLVIFTQNEMWLYQPSVGALASGGKLTRVSDTIGCIGPNAQCSAGGGLVWVDTSGVYQTTNGLSIRPISEDITPFFESLGMTNPLTSYFVENGQTDPANEQPTTTLRLKPKGVKCAFVASMDMLVVSIPELSAALVFSAGKWSWWTFESVVANDGAGSAVVGVTQNLPAPWVLNYQDDLFALAGPDVQALADDAEDVDENDLNMHTISRSFMILEYGRGGAIDRSVTDEDDRKITGYGTSVVATGSDKNAHGGLFFAEPIKVPQGYRFPSGNTTAASDDYILIPVSLVVPPGVFGFTVTPSVTQKGVSLFEAKLSFDNTHWKPVFNHASLNTVEVMLPPERLASAVAAAATLPWTVQTYSDEAMSTPSQDGGYLILRWNGAHAGHYFTPYMNLNYDRHNMLIFLPFKRISAKADENTSAMAWEVLSDGGNTQILLQDVTGGTDCRIALNVFNQWSLGTDSIRKEDSVAQPVDWAYKSTNVGLEAGKELKMRGVWANLLSHGTGAEKLDTAWPYGLFNTLIGSDRKEWMAQIVDMAPTQAAVEQQDETAPFASTNTLRTRVQLSSGALADKVFQSGGTDIVWGDPAASSTEGSDGTVLIGDEDTSNISVSMSVKGQSFSVMHFGFMMNRAEKLMLEGIKAVFRVVGGRRRRGR